MSSNFKLKLGPTSAKKRKGGSRRRKTNNETVITDFDTESCFFGVVESIISSKQCIVRDMKTNKLVHCSTRGFYTRQLSKASPVVFAYLRGDTAGEAIEAYNTDHLEDLCYHFKINYESASKSCGLSTNVNKIDNSAIPSLSIDIRPETQNLQVLHEDDVESSDHSNEYESESEEEQLMDKFGNYIIKERGDIEVEIVSRTLNTITVNEPEASESSESEHEQEIPVIETKPIEKPSKQDKKAIDMKRKNDRKSRREDYF